MGGEPNMNERGRRSCPRAYRKSFAARKAITVENNSTIAKYRTNPFPHEPTTDGCYPSKNECVEDSSMRMRVLEHFCALNGNSVHLL